MSDSAVERVPPARNRHIAIQLLVLAVAFIALYHDTLAKIISNIRTSEGSHGALIVLVILYLLWIKKKEFQTIIYEPALVTGTIVAVVGCFMLYASKLTNTLVLQQLSMIPFLLGFILLLYGYSCLRIVFIPVCYLVFLTGFLDMLLWSKAIHFQRISAAIAAWLLELTGMPVVLSGIFIDLPHISLEVARICSGIGHIVSLMALSVPLAIMTQLTPLRMVFLIVASFFIGLFANGVRIAAIGIYAIYNAGADLHGPNETLYVTFIFFFGMVALIVLSHFLGKKKRIEPSDSVPVEFGSAHPDEPAERPEQEPLSDGLTRPRIVSVVIALSLLVSTAGFMHLYNVISHPLPLSFDHFPLQLGLFVAGPLDSIDERVRPFEMDDELLRSYVSPEIGELDLYIGYSQEQTKDRKIIDARRSSLHEGAKSVLINQQTDPVEINKVHLGNSAASSDIYFFYIMEDRIITNQYVGKLYTFWNGLIKRRTNGAVVVVQTRSSQEKVMPFLEELVPEVMEHLESGE